MWDLRTLAYFQGSEMFPDGIRPLAVLSLAVLSISSLEGRPVLPHFDLLTAIPKGVHEIPTAFHSFPFEGDPLKVIPEARPGDQGLLSSSRS